MTRVGTQRFEVQNSLERAAASFTADVEDTALYRNAAADAPITVKAGYKDKTGEKFFIDQITGGIVDQWILSQTKAVIQAAVSGRDQMAIIGQRPVRRRFLRLPLREVTEKLTIDGQAPIDTVPTETGIFTAKYIAEKLCALVDVSIDWRARDYTLRTDYDADGPILDVLRDLGRAWTVPDTPLAVDVRMDGEVVIVEERALDPIPDYTYTLPHSRVLNLDVRKGRLLKFGTITLEGRLKGPGDFTADPSAGGGGRFSSGVLTETELHETQDVSGRVISRTVSENTYRMPDRILTFQVEDLYETKPNAKTLEHVSRKTSINDYEASIYDESGPVNNPLHKHQEVVTEGILPADKTKTWQTIGGEETDYAYDVDRFLSKQTTVKKTLNLKKGFLEKDEITEKTFRDKAWQTVEVRTEVQKRDKKSDRWYRAQYDVVPQAGYRVGGPGRGRPSQAGDGTQTSQRIRLEFTLSADVDAVDLSFQNEHLDLPDLEYLADLVRAAHLRREHDVTFLAVTMPWLKTRTVILFSGWRDAQGNVLPLPPLLIYAVRLSFDNARKPYQMTSSVQATVWAKDPA